MKKIEIALLVCFGLGVVSRFMKLPYHTFLIGLSALAWLVPQIVGLAKSREKRNSWLGMATAGWMFFFFFKLKFWPFADWLMVIASLLTGIAIYKNMKASQKMFSGKSAAMGVMLLLSTGINFMPESDLYFWASIRFNNHIGFDYQSLDKYSWFLAQENNHEQALAFNSLAMRAAQNAINHESASKEILFEISEHKTLIQQQKWEQYP